MFSRYLKYSLFLPLLASSSSFAYDPFTIMAVVGTAVSVVSTVTDAAGEVAGVTDAMGELYGELDGDAEVSASGQKLVNKLREVEATAREVGYTKEEIESLLQTDRGEVKSLVAVLRKLTAAIRTGKRVMQLISKLEKKAQMAQVEGLEVEKEQLRVQHRLLNELVAQRLNEKKSKLEETLAKKQDVERHLREVKARGAKSFGASGVWTFPKIDKVLEKSLDFAKRIRPAFFGLVLLAFFIRLIFYQFGLFSVPTLGILIRDVILFGLLMCAFPDLVHLMVGVSHQIAEQIAGNKLQELTEAPKWGGAFSWWAGLIWVCSWIRFIAFCLTDFLFNFGLAFLVILFPLVIFMAQMLGLRILLPVFFTMFLVFSLWPFFWNAVGLLASDLWVMKTDSNADILKTLFFTLLQLISPFVVLKILSGQGIGQAVGSVVGNVHGAASRSVREVVGIKQGITGGEKGRSGSTGFALASVARGAVLGTIGGASAFRQNLESQRTADPTGLTRRPASLAPALGAAARGFAEGAKRKNHSQIPGRIS